MSIRDKSQPTLDEYNKVEALCAKFAAHTTALHKSGHYQMVGGRLAPDTDGSLAGAVVDAMDKAGAAAAQVATDVARYVDCCSGRRP